MKRILSILLSLAICLTLLPAASRVHAASVDDLSYYISDGQVTISSCSLGATGSLIIPSTIEGYPVTGIRNWAFMRCVNLTGVTIPDGVTIIGDSAFSGCCSLTSVTIPDSVTSIGEEAFSGCYSLTSVTIPDGVTIIGYKWFSGCDSLTSVTIPGSVTGIGNYAFSGCTSLTSVAIPGSVTGIGNNAFSGCGLTSVTIPGSVTGIGNYAFNNCTSLTSVTISDGVTSIGDCAFRNCSSLTSVTIPDSVTSIGDSAFSGCGLTSVTIPGSVTGIGNYAFYNCTSLTSVTLLDGVTSIGNYAFSDCTSLTSVTIPDSVTSIGDGAFSGCTSLRNIYFLGSKPNFGSYVFFSVTATAWYHAGTSGWAEVTSDQLTGWNGQITLREVAHICPSYTYDNNHTCTTDGTERAVCLSCGETDIREVQGSAAHQYVDGFCLYCDMAESDPNGASLIGNLTTFGEGTAQLTLIFAGETTPAVTLTTEDGTYGLNAAPGEYILSVSKDGNVTRIYTVSLVEGENSLDIKLHLPGDITGDGKITVADVSKAYAHAKKSTLLADYDFQVADVTGDGKITVADVSRLYAHAKKTASLW